MFAKFLFKKIFDLFNIIGILFSIICKFSNANYLNIIKFSKINYINI